MEHKILIYFDKTYLSVALHNPLDGKNQRQPLNLVIVLDVSGSIGQYFHINNSAAKNQTESSRDENKINIAKQIIWMMSMNV